MPSGIFGATLTTLTNGTTANASDVMASLNSLKSNGLNNDSAAIQTDGSGNIITPAGQLRNVTFLATQYQLTTNPTLNNGSTNTYTVTGGSTGVPTGAYAVILQIGIFANTAGGYITIAPHGASMSAGGFVAGLTGGGSSGTGYTLAQVIVPHSGGQIDVKANASNIVLQSWYIIGYIM